MEEPPPLPCRAATQIARTHPVPSACSSSLEASLARASWGQPASIGRRPTALGTLAFRILRGHRGVSGRRRPSPIPVGKRLETDKCPPFLRAIHDLWGHRYIPLAPYACTPLHTGYCAGRRVDISEMRTDQPLPGSIIEYIVHGEFAWQDDDMNSTYRAWWVPLRSMVKEWARRRWSRSWM
eukprot:scaffold67748_cov55-Phaeocystis_antarctica.AAC.1